MAVDLTALDIVPDDRDPQAIVDTMLDTLAAQLPDWTGRNGSLEVVLMEALATGVADAIYAANRLPGVVLEALVALLGVDRDPGRKASGQIVVTYVGAGLQTVPAGARFAIPDRDDVALITTAAASGAGTTLVVPVETDVALALDLPVGTHLDLVDVLADVVDVQVTVTVTGGAGAEDDAAYLDRARTRLARLSSTLAVADEFAAAALEDTRVTRAVAVDLWDGDDPDTIGDDAGHTTVAVYGPSGTVTAGDRDEIAAALASAAVAVLSVHVVDASVTTVDVAASVVLLPGFSATLVTQDVQAAITTWLDPQSWTWGEPVRTLQLAAVIQAVDGVDYVASLTPSADTATAGHTGLAKAGTVAVTVTT